jgi:hypothetical protein
MMIKLVDILKEVHEDHTNPAFDENPMGYILKKYKRLHKNLTVLMGDGFEEYLGGIFIMAGKPTTFKVLLKNGQYFYMTFMGKAYEASVLGKRYFLMNIGEIQRATTAIARILRYGQASKAQGPEGEAGPRSEESPLPTEKEEKPEAPEAEENT